MSQPIVEVRDYTINEDDFAAYCEWAETLAAPWLKENLDLVGFWLATDDPAEVTGLTPMFPNTGRQMCTG